MAYTQKLGEILTAELRVNNDSVILIFSLSSVTLTIREAFSKTNNNGSFQGKKMPSKPDLKDEFFGGIQTLIINPCSNNKQ